MIRPIKITLNAAHPEVPLIEATTFVGSPSAVFVSGVPATVGLWRITAVKVVAHYPDDSATTVECVKGASGVWTATLPATATSGRVTHGFEVLADGTDENGDAVTGYVLGYADFAIFTRDMTIESGGTLYYMHYFDAVPQTPKKGDVAPDGSGGLQLYNGTAWVSMGGYTPPAGGIPKSDLSEGIQASLDKADTALQTAPVTSVNSKTGAVTLNASDVGAVPLDGTTPMTGALDTPGIFITGTSKRFQIADVFGNLSVLNFTDGGGVFFPNVVTTGTLALLQNLAPNFSMYATYAVGQLCTYSAKLYRCTTAIETAENWTAAHWTEATVEDVLAALRGKFADYLPLSGGTMTGALEVGDTASRTAIDPTNGINTTNVSAQTASIAGVRIETEDAGASLGFKDGNIIVKMPISASGTLALLSDILVKSVKLNGTALTPDANGAVDIVLTTDDLDYASAGGSMQLTLALDTIFSTIGDLAPLASPAFTGTPTAPTPTSGDNSTKVATTAFVKNAIDGISVTPLSGNTYDFSTMQGVFDALKAAIEALGGTVTNAPTSSQGE